MEQRLGFSIRANKIRQSDGRMIARDSERCEERLYFGGVHGEKMRFDSPIAGDCSGFGWGGALCLRFFSPRRPEDQKIEVLAWAGRTIYGTMGGVDGRLNE